MGDGFVSTMLARTRLPSAITAQKLPVCAFPVAAGRKAIDDGQSAPRVRMKEDDDKAIMKESPLRSVVKAAGVRFSLGDFADAAAGRRPALNPRVHRHLIFLHCVYSFLFAWLIPRPTISPSMPIAVVKILCRHLRCRQPGDGGLHHWLGSD